ncbi:MAG: nitroreductase family protein [Rectinemataceae bacterium]|jgi:SagB-type dehydrogenase family enzyme
MKERPDIVGDLQVIALPKPGFSRDKSVQSALQRRKTSRTIGDKKLSLQTLSNLLWSACGVNRKKGPFDIMGITAASASNAQEIDIYVALEEGVYRYEPMRHRLIPVVAGDLRALAIGKGQSSFGADAPVRLIYVADIEKFGAAGFQEPGLKDPETQKAYYYVDTGLIAGNVYLFAASQGLAAWFHNCNKAELPKKLGLRPEQRVLFGQTIGYQRKAAIR